MRLCEPNMSTLRAAKRLFFYIKLDFAFLVLYWMILLLDDVCFYHSSYQRVNLEPKVNTRLIQKFITTQNLNFIASCFLRDSVIPSQPLCRCEGITESTFTVILLHHIILQTFPKWIFNLRTSQSHESSIFKYP